MTVRFKLALTIFIAGALTALGCIATVLFAFQRFEHETTYHRANAFLGRVVETYDDLFEQHQRRPQDFPGFLRSLVLFEPDTQLYLLDADGTVLATSGQARLPPGFKVALGPVQQAIGPVPMPYVMGDDPERMDADAVIAAKPVRRAVIRADAPVAGYLYLVAHKEKVPDWMTLGSSFAKPALAAIVAVVGAASLLAWWVIATVTRPLRRLSEAVAAVGREGLGGGAADPPALAGVSPRDEFGQLAAGFRAMLAALRRQDHFRRQGVSNLSHDLRSPLTATVACLETLEARWADAPERTEDRQLVAVALRNTRNAARLVRSLGDLAQLDEPEFKLRVERMDAGEVLDDIALRFRPRAAERGIALEASADGEPAHAALDVELVERAVANLVDNALKFCGPGDRIALSARRAGEHIELAVADTGPGIAADELPRLFDRFYQARDSVAPATGEGGKGLGLAIVKRIAELHGGSVAVASTPGEGTTVTLSLPAR